MTSLDKPMNLNFKNKTKDVSVQICELMKHKVANNVVENFYNEYAGAPERNRMLQEFCGPEFRVFKEGS